MMPGTIPMSSSSYSWVPVDISTPYPETPWDLPVDALRWCLRTASAWVPLAPTGGAAVEFRVGGLYRAPLARGPVPGRQGHAAAAQSVPGPHLPARASRAGGP